MWDQGSGEQKRRSRAVETGMAGRPSGAGMVRVMKMSRRPNRNLLSCACLLPSPQLYINMAWHNPAISRACSELPAVESA